MTSTRCACSLDFAGQATTRVAALMLLCLAFGALSGCTFDSRKEVPGSLSGAGFDATQFDVPGVGDGSADGAVADTITDVSIADAISDAPSTDSIEDVVGPQDVAFDATATSDATTATDTTPSPCPGAEGCACQSHFQCSGNLFCVESDDGKMCARVCDDKKPCDADQICLLVATQGVSYCLPSVGLLCAPCASSDACATAKSPDAKCIDSGPAGSFCGPPCKADTECESGYKCLDGESINGIVGLY